MKLMNKILNELYGEDMMSAEMGNGMDMEHDMEHDMGDYDFEMDDEMPKKHKKGCACHKDDGMSDEMNGMDYEDEDEGLNSVMSVEPEY